MWMLDPGDRGGNVQAFLFTLSCVNLLADFKIDVPSSDLCLKKMGVVHSVEGGKLVRRSYLFTWSWRRQKLRADGEQMERTG